MSDISGKSDKRPALAAPAAGVPRRTGRVCASEPQRLPDKRRIPPALRGLTGPVPPDRTIVDIPAHPAVEEYPLSAARRQFPELNAASKDAAGGSKSNWRRNVKASAAPRSRSMPASSHSTEIGPW